MSHPAPADMHTRQFATLLWGHRRSGFMDYGTISQDEECCYRGKLMHWMLWGISWRGRFIGVMRRVKNHGGDA